MYSSKNILATIRKTGKGIETHAICLCNFLLQLLPFTSLFTHGLKHCWAHVFPWKECLMKEMCYEVRCLKSNEDMILALAGQFLSNCLMNLKNSGDSMGLEPMTSAMPVQCSNRATKSHSWEQVNLLGSCFPVKGMSFESRWVTWIFQVDETIA